MMVSIAEASKFLGMDKQTLRVLIQRGAFPWASAYKISNHYYYSIIEKQFAEATGYKGKEGSVDNG